MGKLIVADSSAIISLAINCMSGILGELGVQILVSGEVYDELITRPMSSKRYALESIRIKKLLNEGIIVLREPDSKAAEELMDVSNSIYSINGHTLDLIHLGEAASLALVKETGADAFLIDERTMRLLLEDAEELGMVLSGQTSRKIGIDRERLDEFRRLVPKTRIIRSSEIAVVAYERGLLGKALGDKRKEALLATLYALKFSGCSISWSEIEDYSAILR